MSNPQFTPGTARFDPYKNFRFRVKMDGRYVAGVSKVSALSHTAANHPPDAPNPGQDSPAQAEFEPITLERGVTHDPDFQAWANSAWDYTNSAQPQSGHPQTTTLTDFRKDIVIELLNERAEIVLAYNVHRCWVSKYQALPELNGMGNAIAIQSIVLQNEGWERIAD